MRAQCRPGSHAISCGWRRYWAAVRRARRRSGSSKRASRWGPQLQHYQGHARGGGKNRPPEGGRYIRYDVSLFIAVSLYRDVSLVYRMYLMYRAEKRWEHARSEMYRFYRNLSDVPAPIHPIIDVSEAMMYRIGKPLLPATQASTRPHTDLSYAWDVYHHGCGGVPCVW